MTKRIAVFASGNGSNFQVIAEQFPVEFVFSDHRDAYVIERAEKLGVLSYAFELKEFENKADYEGAIVELLDEHQIDLVCLAGYMKIVGPTLLAAYEGRIINIHAHPRNRVQALSRSIGTFGSCTKIRKP